VDCNASRSRALCKREQAENGKASWQKDFIYERNEHQRSRLKQILIEAKAKPCRGCGIQYPPHVMDFDHLDDAEKLDDVSRFTRFTKKKLLTEIAKCDVVCSNCHRERTHRRRQRKT
jgi:predicted HNH restriction endonuclease